MNLSRNPQRGEGIEVSTNRKRNNLLITILPYLFLYFFYFTIYPPFFFLFLFYLSAIVWLLCKTDFFFFFFFFFSFLVKLGISLFGLFCGWLLAVGCLLLAVCWLFFCFAVCDKVICGFYNLVGGKRVEVGERGGGVMDD